MTYVAYGPLGPRLALAVSDDLRTWRRLGPCTSPTNPASTPTSNLFPNKDAVFFPEPVPGPDGGPPTRCCTGRCGTSAGREPARRAPARRGHRRATRHLDLRRPGRRGERRHAALVHRGTTGASRCRVPLRGAQDRRRPPPLRVDEGLAAHPPRRHRRDPGGHGVPDRQKVELRRWAHAARPRRPVQGLAHDRRTDPRAGDRGGARRHGAQRRLPHRDRAGRRDRYVFYGMADSQIGVARLDRLRHEHVR